MNPPLENGVNTQHWLQCSSGNFKKFTVFSDNFYGKLLWVGEYQPNGRLIGMMEFKIEDGRQYWNACVQHEHTPCTAPVWKELA